MKYKGQLIQLKRYFNFLANYQENLEEDYLVTVKNYHDLAVKTNHHEHIINAHYFYSYYHNKVEDLHLAINELKKVIELHKKYKKLRNDRLKYYINLAYSYERLGKVSKAIYLYYKVLASQVPLYRNIASINVSSIFLKYNLIDEAKYVLDKVKINEDGSLIEQRSFCSYLINLSTVNNLIIDKSISVNLYSILLSKYYSILNSEQILYCNLNLWLINKTNYSEYKIKNTIKKIYAQSLEVKGCQKLKELILIFYSKYINKDSLNKSINEFLSGLYKEHRYYTLYILQSIKQEVTNISSAEATFKINQTIIKIIERNTRVRNNLNKIVKTKNIVKLNEKRQSYSERIIIRKTKIKTAKKRSNFQKKSLFHVKEKLQFALGPHMINNILNGLLYSIIVNENKHKTFNYLDDLAEFLSEAFGVLKKRAHSISDEIKIIQKYINLEQHKQNKNIKLKLVNQDNINTSSIHIPNLVLQPLIENSIKYSSNTDIELTLIFIDNIDRVLIYIQDDGGINNFEKCNNAISNGTLSSLRVIEKLLSVHNYGKHLGSKNASIIFDKEYKLGVRFLLIILKELS